MLIPSLGNLYLVVTPGGGSCIVKMGLLPASGSSGGKDHPQRLPGSCWGHPTRMVPWDPLGLHAHIRLLPLSRLQPGPEPAWGRHWGRCTWWVCAQPHRPWCLVSKAGLLRWHQGVSRAPPHLHRVSPHTHPPTPVLSLASAWPALPRLLPLMSVLSAASTALSLFLTGPTE